MADVASSIGERGQLILVGGLSLAVIFVALALVLNSAIYTENLATRTSDNPSDTALQFRQDAVAGASSAMDHVNRNGGDQAYSDRYQEYQNTIDEWQRIHANYSAVNGLLTEVRAPDRVENDENEGTLIVDDNPNSEFTSHEGDPDWVVANHTRVRQFRLNVDRADFPSSLADSTVENTLSGSEDSAFYVEFHDGSDSWRVAVYKGSDTSEIKVMSYDPDSDFRTCTAEGPSVQIDVTGGTLNGMRCEALSFMEDLSGTHDISYSNAAAIQGTYELTVDREEGSFPDTRYSDSPDDDTPYTTPAIYSATVELVYDGPSVTYETEVRVAPGEPGNRTVVSPVAQLATFGGDRHDRSFDAFRSGGDNRFNVYTHREGTDGDRGLLSGMHDVGVVRWSQ